jgi:hypothetical protein
MKQYKLKDEHNSTRMVIQDHKLGTITFDAEITNEAEYPFFYENGFSQLFELIETKPISYKGIVNKKKK